MAVDKPRYRDITADTCFALFLSFVDFDLVLKTIEDSVSRKFVRLVNNVQNVNVPKLNASAAIY